MRLGEILIEDGAVAASELAAALDERALATSPRLGAVLIRRGSVAPDAVARALARQHGVPAALARHLATRDPALGAALPPDLALRLGALPLARTRMGDQFALVVCLRDPRDPIALELIARITGQPIVPAVASEAVLMPAVVAAYSAAWTRPAQDDSIDVVFDDASGPVARDVEREDQERRDPLAGGDLTLVGLDEVGVERDESQWLSASPAPLPRAVQAPTALGSAVRTANATAAEPSLRATGPVPVIRATGPVPVIRAATGPVPVITRAPTGPSIDDGWRITGEQRAVIDPDDTHDLPAVDPPAPAPAAAEPPAPAPADEPAPPWRSRAEVHAQLAAAPHRDEIGDAAIAFMAARYAVAAILIVKDGLALGHRGASAYAAPIDTVTVPLTQPSMLRHAHDRAAPFLGVPTEVGPVQDRLLRALGARAATELAVVPVVIGKRVVALAVGQAPRAVIAADAALADLVDLAAAMAEAYVRVIREAKRT